MFFLDYLWFAVFYFKLLVPFRAIFYLIILLGLPSYMGMLY